MQQDLFPNLSSAQNHGSSKRVGIMTTLKSLSEGLFYFLIVTKQHNKITTSALKLLI